MVPGDAHQAGLKALRGLKSALQQSAIGDRREGFSRRGTSVPQTSETQMQDAALQRDRHRVRTIRCVQLRQDILNMHLDGSAGRA